MSESTKPVIVSLQLLVIVTFGLAIAVKLGLLC